MMNFPDDDQLGDLQIEFERFEPGRVGDVACVAYSDERGWWHPVAFGFWRTGLVEVLRAWPPASKVRRGLVDFGSWRFQLTEASLG